MKKTLRFTSAALTLALAAGMALPAFAAAKPSFSKDETVYAVMAPDGSVTSTTVSAHLYNAAGLSGVTDRSTLTDIVNTESDAAFTQNGDSLTWDTTDTDVYYKGNTSRALPVSAAVTYTLDGETAPLENLLGKSGHLTIRIDLTNNETGTVTVNGAERTVVTPFITAVGVVLGEDASAGARPAGKCRQIHGRRLCHPARRPWCPERPASGQLLRRRGLLAGQCDRGSRRGKPVRPADFAGQCRQCGGAGAGQRV